MKSGSIRRSEGSGGAAAPRGGGLHPTVPLPGGNFGGGGRYGNSGGGGGGRLSEPSSSHGSHDDDYSQHEKHRTNQSRRHSRHSSHEMGRNWIPQQQQPKYVDSDDYNNDESAAFSCNSDASKENNNHNVSPDQASSDEKQQRQSHGGAGGDSSAATDSSYAGNNGSSYATSSQTIALFGASGITGKHFLQMALDAGYVVRCLPVDDPREIGGGNGPCVPSSSSGGGAGGWKTIKAGLEDTKQVKRVLHSADFVVVMLNDLLPVKNKEYPESFLSDFATRLYPLMRRQASIQVFLYQATSLASDVRGQTPMLSKVLKAVAQRRNLFLRDQDAVVRKIAAEHMLRGRPQYNNSNEQQDGLIMTTTPHFAFVVTRPTVLLQDGPSSKRLSASKSQPGPFPVAHVDLAEFSLNALTAERLYNSSPYIVADSF